jgi:hypothetical protein
MNIDAIRSWSAKNRLTTHITRTPFNPKVWTATFEPPLHWSDGASKGKEVFARGDSPAAAEAALAGVLAGRAVRVSSTIQAPGDAVAKTVA